MGKTYFISDLHFGHKNILSYDNREFPDIDTNDREIIRRWNEKVSSSDEVWILGDVSWRNPSQTINLVKQLNGSKKLCIGNHDKKLLKDKQFRSLFVEICDYKEISLGRKQGIILSHYPIPCFNNHYYGAYHLYGHVHNSFEWNMMERVKYEMKELYNVPCFMYNVGCMMPYMNYTPQTLDEIVESYGKWKNQSK